MFFHLPAAMVDRHLAVQALAVLAALCMLQEGASSIPNTGVLEVGRESSMEGKVLLVRFRCVYGAGRAQPVQFLALPDAFLVAASILPCCARVAPLVGGYALVL